MQNYENIFKIYKNYYLFYIAKHENNNDFLREVYFHNNLLYQKNSKGENLSHLLCYEGMIEKYLPYLELGGENISNINNETVLHYCISSGVDIFLMIDLINKGFNPLDKNIFGQTSIHMLNSLQAASYFSNWNFRTLSKMEKFLDNEGNTIAHSAAINKKTDIVNFLIKEYPQLKNIKNNSGLTPYQILYLHKFPILINNKSNSSLIDIFNEYSTNSFKLYSFDNSYYEIFINNNYLEIYKNLYEYESSKTLSLPIDHITLNRNYFTLIDKTKPLSLQLLKYEAKELFPSTAYYKNDYNELYKDTINSRLNNPDHNFHFDILKKIS